MLSAKEGGVLLYILCISKSMHIEMCIQWISCSVFSGYCHICMCCRYLMMHTSLVRVVSFLMTLNDFWVRSHLLDSVKYWYVQWVAITITIWFEDLSENIQKLGLFVSCDDTASLGRLTPLWFYINISNHMNDYFLGYMISLMWLVVRVCSFHISALFVKV